MLLIEVSLLGLLFVAFVVICMDINDEGEQ